MHTESRRFTLFLASIAALTSLSIDMSLPAIPAIERQLGLAAGHGGLTMSLFLAGYALTPLVGGPLSDRFGRRQVLLLSLTFFAIAALACSLATSFSMLLFFRLMQGCAAGVATTLPVAIVRDLLTGNLARQRMSEVTTINSIMPIVAPVFGSWVVVSGKWRILFGFQAAFSCCIVVAVLLAFRESLPSEERHEFHPLDLISNYKLILRSPMFLGYALINGLCFGCVFAFVSASPLILMQRMGVTRSEYSLLFSIIATATILGSFISVVLNRCHVSVHRIILAGLILMAGACSFSVVLQIGESHRLLTLLPPIYITLVGFGLISPSVTLSALEPIPQQAGSGSGALRSILMIFGSGISGFVAAYCARHFQQVEIATTTTMAVAAFTALLIYTLLIRSHQKLAADNA